MGRPLPARESWKMALIWVVFVSLCSYELWNVRGARSFSTWVQDSVNHQALQANCWSWSGGEGGAGQAEEGLGPGAWCGQGGSRPRDTHTSSLGQSGAATGLAGLGGGAEPGHRREAGQVCPRDIQSRFQVSL